MQKLKLIPVANAKKLNRNELKNIFGGFGSDGNGDFGSGSSDCEMECGKSTIRVTCYNGCSRGPNWVACNGKPSYETFYCMKK